MSELDQLIDHLILDQGPVNLATYMSLCLNHPEHGYYARAEAIGANADFITSPEISQFFGEMIGLWCVQVFDQLNRPKKIQLLELGPGRGTLMRDILNTVKLRPGFVDAVHITLLETNTLLQNQQAEKLHDIANRLLWVKDVRDATRDRDAPLIILGNEFLDTLPIRQFQFDGTHWHERLIGVKDGKRIWVLGAEPVHLKHDALPDTKPKKGDIVEISPAQINFMDQLAQLMAQGPAVALLIDYGYAGRRFGNTFQALKQHKCHNPLQQSGAADLTSLVCFDQFKPIVAHHQLTTAPLINQAQFLAAMGLEARVNQLIAQHPEKLDALIEGANRLADPERMGALFKVFYLGNINPPAYPFAVIDATKQMEST